MRPKGFLSRYIKRPIKGLFHRRRQPTSQHGSDGDVGSPIYPVYPPSPPTASNDAQIELTRPHSRSRGRQGDSRGNIQGDVNSPESQTMDSLLPANPVVADDPPLPIIGASTHTESSEMNARTGILSLPLELRKKIYAYLLLVDGFSMEEKATTVLPGNGFGSLGIHLPILLTNKQIYFEAIDVLHKDNDWLLVSVEDEAALQATFDLLHIPKRRVDDGRRRFNPFMIIKLRITRGHGYLSYGAHGQSQGPQHFILDLASFNRLCDHRIYMYSLYRQETHLQVYHPFYRPDEPKRITDSRFRVERVLLRLDGGNTTRWGSTLDPTVDPEQRQFLLADPVAYITGGPSEHEARPQSSQHIFDHVSAMNEVATYIALRNDDRSMPYIGMAILRYVHASTQRWRQYDPRRVPANITAQFAQIARMTAPLVLRSIELTIRSANIAQARDAAGVLEDMMWELRANSRAPPAEADLVKMTRHEYACLILLHAKACQEQGEFQEVVNCMEDLFARWSDIPAHTVQRLPRQGLLAQAPEAGGVVGRQRRQLGRYNLGVSYLPLLEMSVEQFLKMEETEKVERAEGVVINPLDYRFRNWMWKEQRIEAEGPCWVWPIREGWIRVPGAFDSNLPDYI